MSVTKNASSLSRHRDRAATTAGAAEKAQSGVSDLDRRLETNAQMAQEHARALRNAEAEVTRLKRALKIDAQEKDRLAKARKKAVSQAVKAQSKAESAEARYEKSVLAELVRREVERDKSAAATPPAAATSADPAPEKPDAGTVTATRTAARRTAARTRAS